MLRQVIVFQYQTEIMHRNFGKALSPSDIQMFFTRIWQELETKTEIYLNSKNYTMNIINYIYDPHYHITLMFITDITDDVKSVKLQINKAHKEFSGMYGSLLIDRIRTNNTTTPPSNEFDLFMPILENVYKNLKPKISLIGFSGVGKTTITRLIMQQDIPTEHVPTISGEIGTIKIGKLFYKLWDAAGQEQFSFKWESFIKDADGVFIVTDSTNENCNKSKFFVDLCKKYSPYSRMVIIGNKQDLPDAVPITDIERILGEKTFSMVATDPNHRMEMVQIIAEVLEIEPEESELFKEIVIREKMIKKAEDAIAKGDIKRGISIFEDLGRVCLNMGEDKVGQDFFKKADSIKAMMEKTMDSIAAMDSITNPESLSDLTPKIGTGAIFDPTLENKSNEDLIKEAQLKISQVNEKMMDLELKQIGGDIKDQEFHEKTARLKSIKDRLEAEIHTLGKD